ncbi:hypothetical protein E3O62_06145 [Cryobacterium sp. TMT2-15-1]|uniref:sensor histidine kinase n=1 Tax=Cryobacterium sp. TMT2-15-1 TaxID=1259246 RepID=UPI00106980F4|nr:histidine kinase [Cryobacterium sp. TMT2-15-1]TFC61096.1 hypothetical protein E3O62_06145 [Cryobacterium sp. TMT2-15-1]
MPHKTIPVTLNERPEALPETVIDLPAHLPLPCRSRWVAASADFIEGLRGERTGDPLMVLADIFASAADAALVCVIGPPGVDSGAGDGFVVHAAHGSATRPLDGLTFPVAGSLCGRALATGRPILVGREEREAAGPESLLMLGPTLVVPLGKAGESGPPAVVLTASRPSGALPFTAVDLDSAVDFARLAYVGRHLERSSTDRARLAVLTDRDRIARELHDRVIQRVFAVGLAVRALGGMTADPVFGRRLADQVGALDAVIADLRTAIFGLSTQADPDRHGLRRRIVDLLDEVGPLFAHPPRVVFSGAIDLLVSTSLADDVVAVVREGLTNVVRHSGTREAEVRVSVAADILTVEIGDTGVGLTGASRRSGVANLAVRAERWQGMVSLIDRAPRGAELRWTARVSDATAGTSR